MEWLHDIWAFPEHHVSFGWWIAFFLASKPLWQMTKLLPVWGNKYARNQRAKKIKTLEALNRNTYALVIYLAGDVVDVALDAAWTCVALLALSGLKAMTFKAAVIVVAVNVSASITGRGIRIRELLNGLADYDARMSLLKARQARTALPD